MTRIESPSSINTYKQCPRKYYHNYIEEIKTLPNIYLIRGNILHSVLEYFYQISPDNISEENYEYEFAIIAHEYFKKEWEKKLEDLEKLNLGAPRLAFFKKESIDMLNNWIKKFLKKLKQEIKNQKDFKQAFNIIKPETEVYFKSEKHMLQGYIDAVHKIEDEIHLIDYKTSARDQLRPEYKLQLAIYSLLYYEQHQKLPTKVGIDFLRHGDTLLDVDMELVEFAKKEAEMIQQNTKTKEKEDYPKQTSRLCFWCDYQEFCEKSE